MESIHEEIIIERSAEYGIIMEKSYTLEVAYQHLCSKANVTNLVKSLNPIWGEHILYFDYKKKPFVIVSAKGASVAVNAVERIKRTGGKVITLIGTCGSTDLSIEDGTMVLARVGVRDEGVTSGYLDMRCPALGDDALIQAVLAELLKRDIHPRIGVAFTTDKRYRENPEVLKSLHEHVGVDYVDMETAAMLLVATYYRIPATALKIVTDCAVKDTPGQLKGIFDRSRDFISFVHPKLLLALDAVMDAYVSDNNE